MMEQTISDVENLTKTVNFNEGGGSDVEVFNSSIICVNI